MGNKEANILKAALNEFGIKSLCAQNLFIENSTITEFHRDQIIFSENKKNSSEYMLLEGLLHRYNINENGEIITTGFYMANDAIMPHSGRTINGKNIFTLQSLSHSILAEIPVKVLNNLRFTNEEFRAFGQKVLETALSKIIINDIAFRSLKARDRLNILRKSYPNIENLISHNIIASYLGITNVSFSRLRNELARQ